MEAKHVAISASDLAKSTKSLKAAKSREHSDSLEFDSDIADRIGMIRGGLWLEWIV